ncbi:negative regulator of flagellin synthesis FlgM [Clostridium pascui]|uniref:flagellar biosynthesis anti-sigma factor FlgM n=1 Tax=Clostridium pascui TaxID=46609 RepID=UPI00195728CB|nr:flagellar biosynthesis anti-sigma factor FlgM [Clostridium pascui]MBM7869465.1 negative regulator of flagellin synthesis FlgM [Clostridium pascui]
MRVGGVNNADKIISLYNKKSFDNKELKDKGNEKDSIQISSLGKSLSAYSTNGELVNSSEKLEKIKEEISKGIYNRDSKLVADSILRAIKEQK